MKIGYTSGVFDLFHAGHKIFLQECKSKCDLLYVGVDSDLRVKRIKGLHRPIQSAVVRVKNVSLYCDHAFIKRKPSFEYFELIQPDVVFESSQKVKSTVIENSDIQYIQIPYTDEISTTKLIELAARK